MVIKSYTNKEISAHSNGDKAEASSSFGSIVDAYSLSESPSLNASLITIKTPDSYESSSSFSSLLSAYSSDDR